MSRPLIIAFESCFFSIYSLYLIARRALKALDKSALTATKDKNIIPFFFKLLYRHTYVILSGNGNDRQIFDTKPAKSSRDETRK